MRRIAALACLAAAQPLARQHRMRRTLLATAVGSARRFFDEHLDRFCDAPFDEARFVDRARLSPLGPRTGVVLTVDAATDTRTRRRVVLKAGATFADHLAGDLLPALLNVSGEHVLTAEACFRRGARDRVAAYGNMDGHLLQLLVANDTGPLRQYVPRRRHGSCFALRAAHDLLRGLAAAHAAGIVNQDVHAGNLLFAGAGPAMRWKISDFGRACVVGAGRCPHVAGSRALAPEAGHVRKTPASDVWSAGFVFLLLRCGGDWGDRRALREWLLRLNEEYGATRKRLGGRDTTVVPIKAWNATSFDELLRAAPPAIRNPAARCRLLARQAREKALPAARERALTHLAQLESICSDFYQLCCQCSSRAPRKNNGEEAHPREVQQHDSELIECREVEKRRLTHDRLNLFPTQAAAH